MKTSSPPAVILVRPQMPENIGAVARAMANFGLKELRIVRARDGWPHPRAREVASGGEAIIDAAIHFDNLANAMKDIQVAYATTARGRDMEKRVVDPAAAMKEVHEHTASGVKTALLFGPERTGLENDDIGWCDTLVSIPTAPEQPSLNLAQATVILGYEWFRQKDATVIARALPELAPKEDWQGLFEQLEAYLDESDFFRVESKKPVMWQNMKNMLLRGQWSPQEIRTLRGVLRILWEGRQAGSRAKKAK